jgi:hypothetical protein
MYTKRSSIDLITTKVIKLATELNLSKKELDEGTRRIMDIANTCIKSDGRPVEIVSLAEMSCLAASKLLTAKNVENIIAIDERTTRLIFEKPEELKKLMEGKLHKHLSMDASHIEKDGTFIRSSELAYVAYKKGIVNVDDKRTLEALLYATRYKGCAISWEEIDELKRE